MSAWTPADLAAAQTRLERARDPKSAARQDAVKLDKYCAGQEKKLNAEVCAYLRVSNIPHIVARTDRASTIRKGWPDVTALWHGRACCVELKAALGRVSKDQLECVNFLNESGVPTEICYNLSQAILFIRLHLKLNP